ncbi:hypothetical protein ACYRFS_11770 [Listeria kieliensis]|uniref:YokE-like PH domain-containing protein n=1 Tax=Listeria kieliensis TaxID=1621700 RepID=A0A3D8TL51_9LIST|nr:hypothetical protein [Listeria kieliensis]RDW99477.1 hypothetical protein UR08_11655 [Listeria kieliensis]
MGLKERLEKEIYDFARENELAVSDINLLYAGPTMRTRHTLVLAFTNVGMFTFQFKLGEAEMHYLAKERLHKVEIGKKNLVYQLKIQALTENQSLEAGTYLVSKYVLGRKWHRATLNKLLGLEGKSLFEGGNDE